MNLLDTLKSLLSPEILAQASSFLGESESATSKGLTASMPSILAGSLGHKADSPAMAKIMELLGSHDVSASPVELAKTAANAGATNPLQGFLGAFLGDKAGPVGDLLTKFAGLKGASAQGLLALAGGLLMNFLGGKVQNEGLNAAGFASLLSENKASLLGALPAGLDGLLSGKAPAAPKVAASAFPDAGGALSSGTKWAFPALALIVLGTAGWMLSTCKKDAPEAEVATEVKTPTQATAEVDTPKMPEVKPQEMTAQGGLTDFELPGGVKIKVSPSGIEKQLVGFITDAGKPVDKTTWFNFDRLLFDTGKSTLKAESADQIANMVAILKAFPAVKLKIGGYTDNVGNPQFNMKLSGERAATVVKAIVAKGITADRLASEGYGDQHPVGDNKTEAGRAQNRRIAARVSAK